jgi:hypothetical protein
MIHALVVAGKNIKSVVCENKEKQEITHSNKRLLT